MRVLREHVISEGAPNENMNILLQFGNIMRAFNASKVRSQPTINTFLNLKKRNNSYCSMKIITYILIYFSIRFSLYAVIVTLFVFDAID